MPEMFSVRSGVVIHTFSLSTQEVEAKRSLSLRPAWPTTARPGIGSETLQKKSKANHYPDIPGPVHQGWQMT